MKLPALPPGRARRASQVMWRPTSSKKKKKTTMLSHSHTSLITRFWTETSRTKTACQVLLLFSIVSKMPGFQQQRKVFGQSMQKKTSYQRQFGGNTSFRSGDTDDAAAKAALAAERRKRKQVAAEKVEKAFGIDRFVSDKEKTKPRRGWLYNVLPTTVRIRDGNFLATQQMHRCGY